MAFSMSLEAWIGVLVTVPILVLVVLFVTGVKIGQKVETLEQFYAVVDQEYFAWDRYFEAGPPSLAVHVTPGTHEPSRNYYRDRVIAFNSWKEPPRVDLSAFVENGGPVWVIVGAADRPRGWPFASFFPDDYPEVLIKELTLIEWKLRLQNRWPKAEVKIHDLAGEGRGMNRRQLEHAEKCIRDLQRQAPHA
jgi:hypothetical protein